MKNHCAVSVLRCVYGFQGNQQREHVHPFFHLTIEIYKSSGLKNKVKNLAKPPEHCLDQTRILSSLNFVHGKVNIAFICIGRWIMCIQGCNVKQYLSHLFPAHTHPKIVTFLWPYNFSSSNGQQKIGTKRTSTTSQKTHQQNGAVISC